MTAPDDPLVQVNLVGIELDLGLYDEARARGEQLVAKADGPLLLIALDALAGVLAAQKDRLALARLVDILEDEATGLSTHAAVFRTAQIAWMSGRPEVALELLQSIVDSVPDEARLAGLVLAARTLSAEIRSDEAELVQLGKAWGALGRKANAIRCLALAGRLPSPDEAIAWAESRGLAPLVEELRKR